jgi:transcriptional regulator with XRE-family HTH domain
VGIGARLTHLRERRGWSMGQLSDRSGVSRAAISRIESGETPGPGANTLGKIAGALGVELSEITGERPMPKRRADVIEGVARVPVMRVRVQASGEPAWDDTRDTIIVSASVAAGRPNIRAAIVSGSCMTPYVMPGERIVFDPDATPRERDMVIVTTDYGDTLVKWYRIDALGRPYLRAADGTEIRPNGAKVEGVVLAVEKVALRDPEA